MYSFPSDPDLAFRGHCCEPCNRPLNIHHVGPESLCYILRNVGLEEQSYSDDETQLVAQLASPEGTRVSMKDAAVKLAALEWHPNNLKDRCLWLLAVNALKAAIKECGTDALGPLLMLASRAENKTDWPLNEALFSVIQSAEHDGTLEEYLTSIGKERIATEELIERVRNFGERAAQADKEAAARDLRQKTCFHGPLQWKAPESDDRFGRYTCQNCEYTTDAAEWSRMGFHNLSNR